MSYAPNFRGNQLRSAIVSSSGTQPKVVVQSSAYAIAVSDDTILVDASIAPVTITLPAATNPNIYRIIKIDGSANAVTIARAGSDTIDGLTNKTLINRYDAITLASDGFSIWYVDSLASGGAAGITALTGDVMATGPGSAVATISNSAVTNAKLANMPANTIKGNNTGISTATSDLTTSQVKTLLNLAGTNSGDVTIGTAHGLSLLGQVLSLSSVLSDITNVIIPTPASGDFLQFNGINWINTPVGAVSAGPSTILFLDNATTVDAYSGLLNAPVVSGLITNTIVVSAGTTVFNNGFLYQTAIQTAVIPAGAWNFKFYGDVSSTAGTSTLGWDVFRVIAEPGTVTITGAGTSRTVTATNPIFVSGDANADQRMASYVQTAGGTFQITSFTSTSVVTITTANGYVNETAVGFTKHVKLFGADSPNINSTTAVEISVTAAETSFVINPTDLLAVRVYGTSTQNVTIHYYEGASTNFSQIGTPLAVLHNSLAGLQGGLFTERYHISAAQAVVVGNTSGTNTGDQTITLTGDVTGSGTGSFTATIAPNAVTNAKMATMANNTVKANKSGLSAVPSDLTLSDVTEITSSILTILNGTKTIISPSNLTIQVAQSSGSVSGYLSSTDWNIFNNKQTAGSYITALTGDATATGPGSAAITFATVNSNVGSFGSASSVSSFTVNAKGLITAASNTSIQIAESQVTSLVSDLAGKLGTALTSSHIFIGSGGSLAIDVAVSGDLTASNLGAFTVQTVGGSTAANVHSAELAANAATTLNTVNTIVKRDASGNFSAGTITATLSGNASTATTAGSVTGTNVVTNTNLAQMPTLTVKGNNTGSTASAIDLTVSQVSAILPVFTNSLNGLVPASGGGTANFLRADGTWHTPGSFVTSVAFSDGSTVPIYSISGSPVTSSGTLTETLVVQSANSVFSGPTTGSPAQPTFRALVSADIPSLSATYLPLAGGTMSGAINMGANKISNTVDPTNPQEVATKNYVDTVASQLNPAQAVQAASTVNIPGAYMNGVAGIGATFTPTATGAFSIDGFSPPLLSRVLLKDQTSGFQNGIYNLTVVGSLGVSPVLTRALDYDSPTDVNAGDLVPVINGTTNGGTSWLQTATITTVGTDSLVFVKWSSSPSSFLANVAVYDQKVTIVASGGNGTTTLNGPVSPGTPITLPSSGSYTGTELQVYLNGQLLFLTDDWNTSGGGPTFTALTFVDTLAIGDVVHFVKLRNS